MAVKKAFSGAAVATTLNGAIDGSVTTVNVVSTSGFPSSGTVFPVTVDQGDPTLQETMFVQSYSGNALTVTRGQDGTSAQAHANAAPVIHTLDADSLNDIMGRLYTLTTKGDILYITTTSGQVYGRLPIGSTGQVLTPVAGVPAWVNGLLAANNGSDFASASATRANLGLDTAATKATSFFAQVANNLSDLASAVTARANLGLGSIATFASSAFLSVSNNLSDLANAATARTNLGLGTIATLASTAFAAVANNLSDLASASAARANLGLGSSATHAASDFLQTANNLSDVTAATARTNLGVTKSLVPWTATSLSWPSLDACPTSLASGSPWPAIANVTGWTNYLFIVSAKFQNTDSVARLGEFVMHGASDLDSSFVWQTNSMTTSGYTTFSAASIYTTTPGASFTAGVKVAAGSTLVNAALRLIVIGLN